MVTALAVTAVLAGCGANGAASSDDEATNGSKDGSTNAVLEELLAKDYPLPYPDSPTKLGEHSITYIAGGLAGGGSAETAALKKTIFDKTGWQVEGPLDGKFVPSEQSKLIQQAVLNDTDAIILDFISPAAVVAGIDAAREAGIPVVCLNCAPEKMPEGVIAVGNNTESMTKDLIPLVVASVEKPDATIIIVTLDEFAATKAESAAQEKLISEQCPQCTIAKVPVTAADTSQPVVPAFSNMLRQYQPGQVDAIITPASPATASLVKIAEQTGRNDFKIFGTYADPPVSTWLQSGQYTPPLYAGVVYSPAHQAFTAADILARIFNGQPLYEADGLAGAIITAKNADALLDEQGMWVPQGLEEKFMSQWELSD